MKVFVYVVSPKHNELSVQYFIHIIIHILNLHPSFNPNVALKHMYTLSPLLHFVNQHVFEQQELKAMDGMIFSRIEKCMDVMIVQIQDNLHIELAK